MKYIIGIVLISLGVSYSAVAQTAESDKILGVWIASEGKGRVKIEKIGNKYYGKIIWLMEPNNKEGKPKTDANNPDPALRSQPTLGLRVLKDFTYDGNNVWTSGTIYDPEKGKTYSCKITLKDDNTLDVRGFVLGMPFLGRTATWTRFTE